MRFAILGDTHFDFHLSSNAPVTERLFDMRFRPLLEASPADVLLLPGDIGHYNAQNLECLKHLRRYYDRVVVTFGNHDYYLISKSIVSRYKYNGGSAGASRARVEEMKAMIDAEEGIDYVDGNVIEINGIRIGGASGWYDGSLYMNDGQKSYADVQSIWRWKMNDANMIHPTGTNGAKFDDLFQEQKHRLDAVYNECDIMMTHVSPLSEWEQFKIMYNYQPALDQIDPKYSANHEALKEYRTFYCFDGKEYLENGSMKHWVFGHTHQRFHRAYTRQDGQTVDIHCNSIGQLVGRNTFGLKVIEL